MCTWERKGGRWGLWEGLRDNQARQWCPVVCTSLQSTQQASRYSKLSPLKTKQGYRFILSFHLIARFCAGIGLRGLWGFLLQFGAMVKPGFPSWWPGAGTFSGLSHWVISLSSRHGEAVGEQWEPLRPSGLQCGVLSVTAGFLPSPVQSHPLHTPAVVLHHHLQPGQALPEEQAAPEGECVATQGAP